MKKTILFATSLLLLINSACTKTDDTVKSPDKNSWFLNTKTLTATNVKAIPKYVSGIDTIGLVSAISGNSGIISFQFKKFPTQDGIYTLRTVADELGEVSVLATDSTSQKYYVSTDQDANSKDQTINVTVNGSQISIVFNDIWLRNTTNIFEWAKTSANINN
jgi:hypothetical protein